MPKPISRREFIRRLRIIGWSGPFPRGKHMAMYHPEGRHVIIPHPHGGDIDLSLTSRLLKQAMISPAAFEAADK